MTMELKDQNIPINNERNKGKENDFYRMEDLVREYIKTPYQYRVFYHNESKYNTEAIRKGKKVIEKIYPYEEVYPNDDINIINIHGNKNHKKIVAPIIRSRIKIRDTLTGQDFSDLKRELNTIITNIGHNEFKDEKDNIISFYDHKKWMNNEQFANFNGIQHVIELSNSLYKKIKTEDLSISRDMMYVDKMFEKIQLSNGDYCYAFDKKMADNISQNWKMLFYLIVFVLGVLYQFNDKIFRNDYSMEFAITITVITGTITLLDYVMLKYSIECDPESIIWIIAHFFGYIPTWRLNYTEIDLQDIFLRKKFCSSIKIIGEGIPLPRCCPRLV